MLMSIVTVRVVAMCLLCEDDCLTASVLRLFVPVRFESEIICAPGGIFLVCNLRSILNGRRCFRE
jgi:hypothetical protein